MLGRSGLCSRTSSDAPSTLRLTPRTVNAVFALPTSQQQHTQSRQPLATGAHGNGDGLTGGPGADGMMHSPVSGEHCGNVSKSAAPATAATAVSVPLKRSLGEDERHQQTEPSYTKRQKQSGEEGRVNHDNGSPLLAFVAPPLPSPQQPQQQQQQQRQRQQQQVGAIKPPQNAISPYQAISAADGVGEEGKYSTWEGFKGENNSGLGKEGDGGPVTNSSEEGWGGKTASPSSLTTDGHVGGGDPSPPLPSSSSSSSPRGPTAPAGERLPGESRASVSDQYTYIDYSTPTVW